MTERPRSLIGLELEAAQEELEAASAAFDPATATPADMRRFLAVHKIAIDIAKRYLLNADLSKVPEPALAEAVSVAREVEERARQAAADIGPEDDDLGEGEG